jgi:DNA-binding MltR family transcriptional regulator
MPKKEAFDYQDFHFREVSKMIVQLDNETDRAVALIVTAWLDDALTEMIKRKLVKDKKVVEEMFRDNAALGTFSSRIGLAYLIRRISKVVYNNLQMIRKIRNDFAHDRENLKFSDESISDRCKNLFLTGFKGQEKKAEGIKEFNPRNAFIATSIGMLGFFIEFISDETMSEDGKIDYFCEFMKYMEEETPGIVAKFTETQ